MSAIVHDCDPGHDDAIALMLALASPELELLGVTTVAGNQTLEKTTANAIRVLDHARQRADTGRRRRPAAARARAQRGGRPCTARAASTAPTLPPPSRPPAAEHAIDWIAGRCESTRGR